MSTDTQAVVVSPHDQRADCRSARDMTVWVAMSIELQQTVLMGLYATREGAIEAVRATNPDNEWEITEPNEDGEFELSHRRFGLFTIWPEEVKS